MSDETLALSTVTPVLPAQGDYDAICAALMRTERGRWFLQEYAKRNRHADTEVLLVAIRRIEAVVRADRGQQAEQDFRSDLLEMAKAITRTRAEVAEIKPERSPRGGAIPSGGTASPAAIGSRSEDVFAAAERIRDVTWAMRGHGFDPTVCGQLEELAASILSASSLRDPTDQRIRKLSEVLQYLELRIDTLLEGSAGPSAEEDRQAADGSVASRAGNELHPDDATFGSQADAAGRSHLQSNDNDVAPGTEAPAVAAVAPLASPGEEAAELTAAAELAQAPEDEVAFAIAPPDDPADISAAIPPEPENGSVLQQAPEADPEAAMEPGETLRTLLPAVELPKTGHILLKPVVGRAFPLISRESPASLFLKGIETGAAVWDFGSPAAAETPSAVAPLQADSGHIDIAWAEHLPGEPIQGEGAEIDSAQPEPTQAELAQAERARAELAQAELAQVELAQAELAKAELARAELAQVELAQAELAQAELARAEMAQAELAQAEMAQAELAQAELARVEPARAELAQAEIAQAELAQADLAQAELAQAELARAEMAQAEPAQIDLAQLGRAEVAALHCNSQIAGIEASRPEATPLAVTQVEPIDAAVRAASGEAQAFNSTLLEMGNEPTPPTEEPRLGMPATKLAAADAGAHPAAPVESLAGSARVISAPAKPIARALRSPDDPLAALEAMSDEERIALFT
jgi:chemotaxis protein CheZ